VLNGAMRNAQCAMRHGLLLLIAHCSLRPVDVHAVAPEAYNPSWSSELSAANNPLFYLPTGASAWLEDQFVPWWQGRVANPVKDYSAALLPVGGVRLDTALDLEYTIHRTKKSWDKTASPSGINNVYDFTPGSRFQEDQTSRMGQNAYVNLGVHPIETISGDIGAELVGNYDQRYWHPVNDEHRMRLDGKEARIVRSELKYDDGSFLLRGFQGVPMPSWVNQNDLFMLYPGQMDYEYPRRMSGTLVPVGGQLRYRSDNWGTLDVIGGAETRWDYGSGVYAKYDLPKWGNAEQSLVYRNENITYNKFSNNEPNERRWALSYNNSYLHSERVQSHWGILYQPYRLSHTYADTDQLLADGTYGRKGLDRWDAMGFTGRAEWKPTAIVDQVGAGLTHLGLAAGNKNQLDLDARKAVLPSWTLAGAYIYRRPLEEAIPFRYAGTVNNPGAMLSSGRGPDDAFRVEWDNRVAHIANMTLVYDPTPGTWFFKNQPNVLESWNLNPDEESALSMAVQYRVTHYPTNADRLYYRDEDRRIFFDPIFHVGPQATDHPFHSATGLLQLKGQRTRWVFDLSGGEALAGLGLAYTPETDYYKTSTIFMQGGVTLYVHDLKLFGRYGRNVWGPNDYQIQQGLGYKKVYQAGLSYQFLKQFESGFRYVGTRQGNDYLGADLGAFNEYRFYLTWHFGLQKNFRKQIEAVGRAIPRGVPQAALSASHSEFTPDGSGPVKTVTFTPRAASDVGLLSWRISVRNLNGDTLRKWEGRGLPERPITWDGLNPADGKSLPAGVYKATLDITDVNGNEVTSTPATIELKAALKGEEEVAAPAPTLPSGVSVKNTAEGLRVTLSSLVLFDTGKWDLKPTSKKELDQVAQLLKAYPTNQLRITGHTDSVGSDPYNQSLSEKRAQSVADNLVQSGGVSKSRLRVVGWGKKRPVASNDTPEGRQQNRRVEIDILK